MQSKTAVLLVNLGTPTSTSTKSVRVFLREFLTDSRVIDLPGPLRQLLVNCLILPFRSTKTAHAYKQVWTKDGSPLLVNSRKLQQKLTSILNNNNSHTYQEDTSKNTYEVLLAMRYGEPKLKSILNQLDNNNYTRIIIVPLYPQYASATNGSVLEKSLKYLSDFRYFPEICCINEFYSHPSYVNSLAHSLTTYINTEQHILFSYHGLPEKQSNETGYSKQCVATTELVAKQLNLNPEHYSTSFQSRLGKLPWTRPYTIEIIKTLRERGIKNLLVISPSFITDCLETLEELDIRLREEWLKLGGESFTLVPCLNDDDVWVTALANIIKS